MANPLKSLFKLAGTITPPGWKGKTPDNTTIFAIGDVHGYDDALASIYDQIDQQREQIRRKNPDQNFIEISLSDVTDRGERTRECIDLMVKRYNSNKELGVKTRHVLADHEILLQEMLRETQRVTSRAQDFFNNGGLETLRSYGVTPRLSGVKRNASGFQINGTDLFVHYEELKKMKDELWDRFPKSHAMFLKRAVPLIDCGQYTFVHGGIDHTLPVDIKHQDLMVLAGVRSKAREFATYEGPIIGDRIIVRAHTVTRKPVLTANQIGIDTGIYKPGGKLTCVVLQGPDVSFLQAGTSLPPYNVDATAKRAAASSDQAGPVSAWAPP